MLNKFNLVIAGVGGQGVLTLSRIIAQAVLKLNLKVFVGETLGMAQRGGIVQSYVRFGSRVEGPLIEYGRADALIALDYIEALRAIKFISSDSFVIVNSNVIPPTSTLLGLERLPGFDEVKVELERYAEKDRLIVVDANSLAVKAGLPIAINVVMLGVFASIFKRVIPIRFLRDSMCSVVPKKYLKENLRAFELGVLFMESSKNT